VLLNESIAITRSGRRCESRPGHERSRRAITIMGALACVLLWQSTSLPLARAQATDRVLVIPLESTVPDAQADIVLAFNLALAQLIEQDATTKVTVAQTSLDDTMAIVGCSERSASCLTRVAEALEVDYIVFGSAAPGDAPDTFAITLVVARRDGAAPPVEHSFSVQSGEVATAESAFAGSAPAGLLHSSAATGPTESVAPAAGGSSSAKDRSYTFNLDRVEQTSWIVTGAGGALLGTGVVFWLLASSSQSDVNKHPLDNVADFDRLVELEDRTQNRATIGNALVVTGAVTAVVGVVLAVRQGLVREPSVTVTPMVTGTSVGLTLVLGWPR
jgi:hypothetical protein